MIEHSPDITNLIGALHAAQASFDGAAKKSLNPHFNRKYASLESVIHAAKEPLQANGLAFTQAPGAMVEGAIEITTMLMHISGQWLRSTLHVPLAKKDPQGVGSAITYGCRYSLMAALGLPPVDDDAESAVDRSAPTAPAAKPANVITSGKQGPALNLEAYRAEDAEGQRYWDEARAAMKKCVTKDQLRDLFEARKNDWDQYITQAGWKALQAEMTAVAKTLPDSTMEAA